jgi:hypothetical protein
MHSTLRNRLGIPGVISVIALVFAMFGGAYAASSSGGGSKATASAKAKRGPRGPRGATGPAGPVGPAGTNGKDGAPGTSGKDGTNGTNGKSLTTGTATVAECAEGGATIEVESTPASKKKICNGAKGAEGSPWTAGGVLPSGKTETGTWASTLYGLANETPSALEIPISFPIPMPAPSEEGFFLNAEETESEAGTGGCTGTVVNPTAPPGVLCVYTRVEFNENIEGGAAILFNGENGYGPPGALIRLTIEGEPARVVMDGTWAVTAPQP